VRSMLDAPDRPTAPEAIRTVFAAGTLSVGVGLAMSGRVALGMVFGGSITEALLQSTAVVFFTGFGVLAMAASFVAHHARRRYEVVPREDAVVEGGDSA
jgi:hypothetical protein